MSESAPTSAPAPAPTAQASLPLGTPAAAPPSHHSAAQPRTPAGQFAGAPDPTKAATPPAAGTPTPEAPKAWKVGNREFKTPEELALYASEADAERSALDEHRKRAAEAAAKVKEYEARLKDPHKLVTPEMRQAILQAEIRAFQKQEYLQKLDPAARELFLLAEERDKRAAELEALLREREEADAEAKRKADAEAAAKEEAETVAAMRTLLTSALDAAGLPPTPANFSRVTLVVRGAAERGVVYDAQVIASKVKKAIEAERRESLGNADPVSLLNDVPALVERLNAIEDPAVLRKLAPLGEKLRRLNLESLGTRPTPVPTPVATGAGATAEEANPEWPPGDPRWEKYLRTRLRG